MKTIKIIFLIIALTTSVNASTSKSNIHISTVLINANDGAHSDSGIEQIMGYGFTNVNKKKFLGANLLFAGSFDIAYGDSTIYTDGSDTEFSFLINCKVGLESQEKRIYAIVGIRETGFDYGYVGFGFGLGTEYKINKNLVTGVEVIKYSMKAFNQPRVNDLDLTTVSIILKYVF